MNVQIEGWPLRLWVRHRWGRLLGRLDRSRRYYDPGKWCPVYDGEGPTAFRCSRDAGHRGAHVNRADRGRGMIGWAPWAGETRGDK